MDDNGTELLAQCRFPPGHGPFHIKGTAYLGHLDYVNLRLPGGLDAMMDALDDLGTRDFFLQTFAAPSLYDVVPLALAGKACAQVLGVPFLTFVSERTKGQAETDLRGMHPVFLQAITAKATTVRVPRLLKQYFDFGEAEVTMEGASRARALIRAIPAFLAPWFATVSRIYIETVLRVGVHAQGRVEVTSESSDGHIEGFPAVAIEYLATWPVEPGQPPNVTRRG